MAMAMIPWTLVALVITCDVMNDVCERVRVSGGAKLLALLQAARLVASVYAHLARSSTQQTTEDLDEASKADAKEEDGEEEADVSDGLLLLLGGVLLEEEGAASSLLVAADESGVAVLVVDLNAKGFVSITFKLIDFLGVALDGVEVRAGLVSARETLRNALGSDEDLVGEGGDELQTIKE